MKKLLNMLMVTILGAMLIASSANALKKRSSAKTGPFFPCYTVEKYDGKEDAVQVRIGGGIDAGFYITGAQRLTSVMGFNSARKLPWGCAEYTSGAGENVSAIGEGDLNAGFIQSNMEIDLYTDKKYKNFMSGKVILPTRANEAVLLVMKDNHDEDNLEDKNFKMYIGSKNGGNLSVLNALKKLNKDMKNIQPISYEDLFKDENGEAIETDNFFGAEIDQLLLTGKINGILRTTIVKPGHPFIKRIIDTDGIHFTSVNDVSFNNSVDLGDGIKRQIFFLETVTLDFDGFDTKVKTPLMPIKLLVDKANMNPKAYIQLRNALEYTLHNPFKTID